MTSRTMSCVEWPKPQAILIATYAVRKWYLKLVCMYMYMNEKVEQSESQKLSLFNDLPVMLLVFHKLSHTLDWYPL